MQTILLTFKKYTSALMKLLPLLAFAVPFLWLYFLHPASFELMWKGRTFQLFFLWLIVLELILGWENLQNSKISKLFSARALAFVTALAFPTIYVIVSNYFGLNTAIANSARQSSITWWESIPISTEYLVFAVLFCLIIFLSFGTKGLMGFSVPAIFLGAVGILYTIDNIYPYGQFTPFQLLVPTTATLAAAVLGLMGYQTSLTTTGNMPRLTATDPTDPLRSAIFDIAWPCAGIESLIIYTAVTLLFLKRMHASWKAKINYFAIGAAVTYLINILRIVTIFTIGINRGDVQLFHFYYGPLYSIAWIVSYPMIILGSQSLRHKIAKGQHNASTATKKTCTTQNSHV